MKMRCIVCAAALLSSLAATSPSASAAEYSRVVSAVRNLGRPAAATPRRDPRVAPAGYYESVTDAHPAAFQVSDQAAGDYVEQPVEPAPYESLPYYDGGVESSCGPGGCAGTCAPPCDTCFDCVCRSTAHFTSIFADYLYLRPRDAEVAYAVPIDGPITGPPANNPIQVGRVATVDPNFQGAYRAGFNVNVDCASSVEASFTRYENETTDEIFTSAPDVLRSLVAHPSSGSAASDFLEAGAELNIDFDLVDVTYRRQLACGPVHAIDYLVGTRYAKLEQSFGALFENNGVEAVFTDVEFEGAGVRFGLAAERFHCSSGLSGYGTAFASFLAGEFDASYFQGQNFDQTVVEAEWSAGRIVPILDLEFGVAWTSPMQKLRVSAGYLYSAWLNAVKTEEFIQAVQENNFLNLDSTVSFDGLRIQAVYLF